MEAYERILHDVMLKDHLLFTRSEQIERIWEVCAPLIENPPKPETYEKGSWGPHPRDQSARRSGLATARRSALKDGQVT